MNTLYVFSAAAVFALTAGCGEKSTEKNPTSPTGGAAVVAAFADTNLEGAVRQALKRPVGALRAQDLAGLGELEARGRGIVSLQGIGQLLELTRLDLADNRIEDLAPLASLSALKFLDLDNNRVRDLSALAGLSQLEVVVLGHNQVQDLTPLLGLGRLKSAELSGNPLNGGVENAQLAALQEKGVGVSFQVGVTLPPDESNALNPVFRLAFVKTYRSDRGDIFLLETDGSEPINLTNKEAIYAELAWSPDGAQIAFLAQDDPFIHGYNIFVMNEDGSNLRRLLERYDNYSGLAWSPDGGRIVCVHNATKGSEIVVVNPSGGEIMRIDQGSNSSPAWSPDGTKLAFTREIERKPVGSPLPGAGSVLAFTYDIYTANADGSDQVKVVTAVAGASGLGWSPDGRRLIFSHNLIQAGKQEPADIYLVEVNGGTPSNLTRSPEEDWQPIWSPDGTKVAFLSTRGGSAELHLMNTDGSSPMALSYGSGWIAGFHWAPDGSGLVYIRNPFDGSDAGMATVYFQAVAMGSERVELMRREDITFFLGRFAWAPR